MKLLSPWCGFQVCFFLFANVFVNLRLIFSCFPLPWPLKDLSGVPHAPVLGGLQFYRRGDYSSANIKNKKKKEKNVVCQTSHLHFFHAPKLRRFKRRYQQCQEHREDLARGKSLPVLCVFHRHLVAKRGFVWLTLRWWWHSQCFQII